MPKTFPPTPRTRIRRRAGRGVYDKATVEAILDEGLVAHVGFVADGQPYVMPMLYARAGDALYLHGSPLSRLLGALRDGVPVCVTVTLVDGLVLARSAFHHSLNYRSVMLFGRATRVDDDDEKRRALLALVEHVVPGRAIDARPPTDGETRKTLVLRVPIVEASAKVRTGGPIDDADDLVLDVWAGVIPCRLAFATPQPDPDTSAPIPQD